MSTNLYPFKFQPIFKERIWGGNKLATVLNKKTNLNNIGESWEISDVEGDISIVSNGHFKGVSLKYLQQQFGAKLIGNKNYKIFNKQFPILIKFIDAKRDLSIQLHPNNELAAKRHNSSGKTEMWYVLQADDNANLVVDFNQPMNKNKYLEHLTNKTLPEVLNFAKVKKGDSYFIDVGRVHAIGAGVMLAEIQQTSDVTYRIYDWDRKDADGNSRELHIDLAQDAIDFKMPDNYRVEYDKKENVSNNMVTCDYFTTNYLELTQQLHKVNNYDSFVIYLCVEGEVRVENDDFSELLKKGETILVPAAIKTFKLKSNSAKLLEVYV